MPRKASEGPRVSVMVINVTVANMMTHPEMRRQIDKDLNDPNSGISRYLTEKFGYNAAASPNYTTVSSIHRLASYVSLEKMLGLPEKEKTDAP